MMKPVVPISRFAAEREGVVVVVVLTYDGIQAREKTYATRLDQAS